MIVSSTWQCDHCSKQEVVAAKKKPIGWFVMVWVPGLICPPGGRPPPPKNSGLSFCSRECLDAAEKAAERSVHDQVE